MPTAITHFKFPTLPDINAVESLINAVPLVVDTLYPIADQNLLTFERTSQFDNLSLKAPFLYKVVRYASISSANPKDKPCNPNLPS